MELKELIIALSDSSGVTGLNGAIKVAETELQKLGRVEHDHMGGIAAIIEGNSDYTIMLDAHIDEIGMIVTEIDGDFIRVSKCGGID
ncbi:MAG: M42 family peptidase, partial [Clostridia bacterium]|nr:M42 family peptidase [Clostridia bacterium]